jgi:hypothetical protein
MKHCRRVADLERSAKMKLKWRIVISAVAGCSVVLALDIFGGGQFRSALYWSLPFVEKVFPPLDAGPSPDAMLTALALDASVVATGISALLSHLARRRKEPNQPPVPTRGNGT